MINNIPDVNFVVRVDGKFETKKSDFYFANKKIVLFALPGAFTRPAQVTIYQVTRINMMNLKKLALMKFIVYL